MKTPKILLVDDNPDNIYLLEVILQARDYTTVSAKNGKLAVEAIESDKDLDLILMDVMMPVMDGFEASRIIRNRKESAHIPIIMMTAKKRELGDVVRGLEEGAMDYITKPFDEDELVARVKTMLRTKSLYDENNLLLGKVLKQQSIMEQELKVAARVQLAMLPEVGSFSGTKCKIDAFYRATVDIGGDFYDFMEYGKNKAAFFIADVSGHGPSAAMIVAMLKALLNGERHDLPPPSELMRRLNRRLLAMIPEEHFITGFFAVADTEEQTITFCRAGHPFPFILGAGETKIRELNSDGDVLGMFEAARFEEITQKFVAGDKLFMYSDGIYEVNNKGTLFGMDRLKTLVNDKKANTGKELIDAVIKEVDAYWDGESALDDMAIVTVEFI
jgi:sigma-B regulation protein RsbU (phosphoserine phosphatase)